MVAAMRLRYIFVLPIWTQIGFKFNSRISYLNRV